MSVKSQENNMRRLAELLSHMVHRRVQCGKGDNTRVHKTLSLLCSIKEQRK